MVSSTSKMSDIFFYLSKYTHFLSKPYSPILANIDLTMQCNSRCRYCLRWKEDYELGTFSKGKDKELTTRKVYRVLDNLAKLPLLTVTFQGAESLVRKDVGKILKYAKKVGLTTLLITNGILLEKKAKEIAPYVDTVLISYDTHIKKDYKYLRGVDALPIVERGIKKIVELSKIHKFLVITNSVLTKINAKYIDKVIDHVFNKLGVHGMSFEDLLVFDHKRCSWKHLKIKSKKTFNKVVDTLVKAKEKYPIMNSSYYLNYLKKKFDYLCKPWLFIMVNADGKVTLPCAAFPKKVIDFTKTDAYKEWYSDKKIWDFKCSKCSMQCIIETSKLFPFPPVGMFMEWYGNLSKARARMAAAAY